MYLKLFGVVGVGREVRVKHGEELHPTTGSASCNPRFPPLNKHVHDATCHGTTISGTGFASIRPISITSSDLTTLDIFRCACMMYDSADITGLSNLISDSVSSLVEICTANNSRIPRLDEDFTPASEVFRSNKDAGKAVNIIAAAAFQLVAILLPPQETIFQAATGHLKSAALRVAITCHVPEILHNAGPEGLHSKVIAKKSGVDDMKLTRLLRYLANQHIFREVTPDVFAHNRISKFLDTGKSIDEILDDPESKHDETNGFVALAEIFLTEGHKGSAYLSENMKDPKTSHSVEINHAPLQRGLGMDMSFWEWYALPEQHYLRHRFGLATRGDSSMEPPNFIANAFDWNSLPKDSPIVDVGGGIGNSAVAILKASPQLHVIIQDNPSVAEQAAKFWEKEIPGALVSQRIKMQAHDMFTPQPVKNACVFLLKDVLHDWPDAQCVKLLTHLRNAAMPNTRLIILDSVISYTRDSPSPVVDEFEAEGSGIPGLTLWNANEMRYSRDILMMICVNSQERTLDQFRRLFELSGWRMVKVTRGGYAIDCVQALPA